MSGTLSNNGATSHWYTGNDTSDLGRWAWTRLSWKDKNITIISAYRPYKSFTGGVHTVYAQHTRYLLVHQEPWQHFLVDLKAHIQTHQDKGDIIILGMDLKDPAQRYDITKNFDELNMKEEIQSIHIGQRLLATNILNESEYPIDEICYSIVLTVQIVGYSNFGKGNSIIEP